MTRRRWWWACTEGGLYFLGPFRSWSKARIAAARIERAGAGRAICREQAATPGALPWSPGMVDNAAPRNGLARKIVA